MLSSKPTATRRGTAEGDLQEEKKKNLSKCQEAHDRTNTSRIPLRGFLTFESKRTNNGANARERGDGCVDRGLLGVAGNVGGKKPDELDVGTVKEDTLLVVLAGVGHFPGDRTLTI